jgi:enolase
LDKIKSITAREILAARGNLCLEVVVTTESGAVGRSTPEVGVSTGTYEAAMLLDGGERYGGMGATRAARSIVTEIAPHIVGMDVTKQREVDQAMIALDGTPNKARLGANAIVGVSLAVVKAAAAGAGLPLYQYVGGPNACVLPMPVVGIGSGGRYRDPGTSRWFKPTYEFIAYGAKGCADAMEMCWRLRQALNKLLVDKYGRDIRTYAGIVLSGVLKDDRELLEAMTEAILRCGYENKVSIYFDVAADCYYEKDVDRYVGLFAAGEKSRDELIALYQRMVAAFPIRSMEDPLREDDYEGHALVTRELGIEIVGDDLFTTNLERLKKGVAMGAANSMVLKITQVGTVSEALDAALYCKYHGYNVHPCGSRGDTDSIADFSVALNAGQVRAVDANRMLSIEQELGSAAVWPGLRGFMGARNQA